MTIAGLRVLSNKAVPVQARPATRAQGEFLMRQALSIPSDPTCRLAMTLYVAWKTGSRWSDVSDLRRQNFIHFDHERRQVVVEWGSLKTNRRQRFRATMFTVIQEDQHPQTLRLLETAVRGLARDQLLTTKNTDSFRRWLRSFRETRHLGAHSIKRGVADELMDAAAEGRLDVRLIPLVLKHQDALHEFPAATLRYAQRKVAVARALRTQDATKLL